MCLICENNPCTCGNDYKCYSPEARLELAALVLDIDPELLIKANLIAGNFEVVKDKYGKNHVIPTDKIARKQHKCLVFNCPAHVGI
jgi:hypothetical protein